MIEPVKPLDAETELKAWFAEARLRLPNRIQVEMRFSEDKKKSDGAMIGLSGENIVCTMTIFSGGDIGLGDRAGGRKDVYGNFEYIVHAKQMDHATRCKDTIITDSDHLRNLLDESLDDFLSLATTTV